MKKILIPISFPLFIFLLNACKQKEEKKEEEHFFPVISILKSQVAQIDTSLYSIVKITYIDSLRSDTGYYRSEQFRELASDLLKLPDISDPSFNDRYKEEKHFDETLNRAIFMYLPVNPENEQIQREQLLIRPGPPEDKITSIIIDYAVNNKDSSVQKNMLWQVDRKFHSNKNRQPPGQKEKISKYKGGL